MKPLFLDLFEEAHATLQALAAQDTRPLPKGATPEAQNVFYNELWEKHVRMLSVLRETNYKLSGGLETIRDLHLSKDPDVERMAQQIWIATAAQRCKDQAEAFHSAEKFIALRNQRRAAEHNGGAAKPAPRPVATGPLAGIPGSVAR